MNEKATALIELAERCEAVADDKFDHLLHRQLDLDIARLCYPRAVIQPPEVDCEPYSQRQFTSSISAAMKLVPEGYWWNVGHVMGPSPLTQNKFWALCIPPGARADLAERPIATDPALALTAAALRAIAAQGEG